MEQNTTIGFLKDPSKPPLLNEDEAAVFLNVDVKTLQYWRWKGGGPRFVKLGRLVRYEISALDAYIDQNRKSHTSDY